MLTVLLALGSLSASRVMDDDALLSQPDRYNPHPKQDRMVQLTVKKSGVTFCIEQGEWKLMKGNACEREETSAERVNRLLEELRQKQADLAIRERFERLSDQERHQLREKRRRELLGGPRFLPRWEIVSLY
jgi:hypothetical protein